MKKKASYRPELRTYVAHARMNEEEWRQFNSQAEKLGLSQSEFIRQSVFTAKVEVNLRPVYDSETLDKIASEYGKIGSNINQIARHLNEGNPFTAQLQKNLNHCLADLSQLQRKIEEMAGEL